jgi:zinc transporter 2
MGLALHGACLSSHHGHSHGLASSEDGRGTRGTNINMRAAVIHVVGDLVQSVGVFVSAIVIKFYVSTPLCSSQLLALYQYVRVAKCCKM